MRTDDEDARAHERGAEIPRDRHGQFRLGKVIQRGVSFVHEGRNESPHGVIDEGESEECEGEGAERSIPHAGTCGDCRGSGEAFS